MAHVRPKRANTAGEKVFEEVPVSHPVGEKTQSFFSGDYSQMHSRAFAESGGGRNAPSSNAGIRGPSGCTLETLVSTLATLQFTTKGKVGEDGKFELIFCSPEPVVSEEKPAPRARDLSPEREAKPVTKRVEYADYPHERRHRHRRSKRPSIGWIR